MTSFADTKAAHVPARKLGAKENQIIQMEQFGEHYFEQLFTF